VTQAQKPFVFKTVDTLVELTGLKARNLGELLEILRTVDRSSIYYHTYHLFRQYHFLTPNFPSDFAYWVSEILQEKALGEKLTSLDFRDFGSIEAYREKIAGTIARHLETTSHSNQAKEGLEFHFCSSKSIVFTTGHQARTLEEFERSLRKVDLSSIYYHFIEFRARVKNPLTNEFSEWLDKELLFPKLAEQIRALDPFAYSLDGIREKILTYLARELYKDRLKNVLSAQRTATNIAETLQQNKYFRKLKSLLKKDHDKNN